MSLFDELKRRNVFRVGFAYALVGWLVAQVADLALENFGAPEWVMKTLLFLILIGFLIALFIAWAYELTPEGIKRAEDVDPNQSVTHHTGRKLDRLVIFVLLISVGLLLFDRFWNDPPAPTQSPGVVDAGQTTTAPPGKPGVATTENHTEKESAKVPDERSVAVLPFVNMSSDPEQEYFSDGISEEILNVLTRIPNLKVAARTSSFQFKGKNLDIADIGTQLQVNHLLEGSVRKSGKTLRITAQLVETDTGFHLWSETYDRNLENVFAIQDEIAAAIAVELRTLFSDKMETNRQRIDMQAYEIYLKGRSLVASRQEKDLFEGIRILGKALEIEPDYAPAMATLAKAYVVLPWFSNELPPNEAREHARDWAEKALQIDPESDEALSVLAVVLNELDINPAGAIELLQRAIKLNPGSITANNFLGDVYLRVGDFDNALKYELRAAELDPLAPVHLADLASVYLLKDEYNRAISFADRALALDPAFSQAHQSLGYAYYCMGDTEQLARVFRRFSETPNIDAARVIQQQITLNLVNGNHKQVEDSLDKFEQAQPSPIPQYALAANAIQLGDIDRAAQFLLKAFEARDHGWIYPLWIRLPEQAPESEAWQQFWSLPEVQGLVELRRKNGLNPHVPTFGSGATQ